MTHDKTVNLIHCTIDNAEVRKFHLLRRYADLLARRRVVQLIYFQFILNYKNYNFC